MKRSINFSGRQEILESSISATVNEVEGRKFARVEIDFAGLDISENSTLVLEFYRTGEILRTNFFGTFEGKWSNDVQLDKLRNTDSLKLRVKVVDLTESGVRRVLFVRDNIHIEGANSISNSDSLLKIRKDPELRSPWSLKWEDDEPILLVSDRNNNAEEIYRSAHFQVLVLPSVLKLILRWAFKLKAREEETDHSRAWVTFSEKFLVIQQEEMDEDYFEDHVEQVVADFAEANGLMAKLNVLYGAEDQEHEN